MVKLATSHAKQVKASHPPAAAVNGFPAENELKDLRFKLAHNLQSTLHLQTTIELFYDNIQDLVEIDGIAFELNHVDAQVSLGKAAKHSATYSIASASAQLGKIFFYRNKRFAEAELTVFEMLIGVLFYPLRNALLYREALELSMRDPLTGIGNRQALDSSFDRELKLSKRHDHPLALLVIDIDHFKDVNDKLGHQNGDKVLQKVVSVIQQALRETDQIFRFGGEEFIALLNNTDIENARLIAERIRLNVAMTPIPLKNEEVLVTISAGVSSLKNEDTEESLLERADSALYRAKSEGRNKVCCD